MTTTTFGLAGGGLLLYYLRELIQEYGLKGALNYIWEGDPYATDIRPYMHGLHAVSNQLIQDRQTLDQLHRALKGAQTSLAGHNSASSSDAVTGQENHKDVPNDDGRAAAALILASWMKNFVDEKQNAAANGFVDGTGNLPSTNLDLKSVLGGLSYGLDQMAAKIDAIPAITGDDTVKKYKKELSNQVVTLMDRTDSMIAFYQQESALALK